MTFVRFTALSSIVVLLGACMPKYEVSTLEPSEVLSRAASASRSLQSVAFTLDATFDFGVEGRGVTSGTVGADGRFHGGGTQAYADVSTQFTSDEDDGPQGTVTAEFVLDGTETSFFMLNRFDVRPATAFMHPEITDALTGRWWRIDLDSAASDTPVVSPDPRLLRAQTEVVRVTNEHGVMIRDDERLYHYDVTVDTDKFVAYARQADELTQEEEDDIRTFFNETDVEGELWIDADTFRIAALSWHVERNDEAEGDGVLRVDLDIEFSNHDRAEPITPPVNAEPFTSTALMPPGIGNGAMNSPDLTRFDTLSREEQEQLIDTLVNGDESSQ